MFANTGREIIDQLVETMFDTREPCVIYVETDYSKAVFACFLALMAYWLLSHVTLFSYKGIVALAIKIYKLYIAYRSGNLNSIVSNELVETFQDL